MLWAGAAWADETAAKDTMPEWMPPLPEEARRALEVRRYRREDGAEITEYRIGGRVFLVRVVPPAGKPYYLVDDDGDGVMETRLPGGVRRIRAPLWIIKRF